MLFRPSPIHALENQDELALPSIVLGEYLFGIHQSKRTFRFSFSSQWFVKPLSVTPRSGMS
jgi:predicted nucleic acid-binding protein